jgi:hypothetical protein
MRLTREIDHIRLKPWRNIPIIFMNQIGLMEYQRRIELEVAT